MKTKTGVQTGDVPRGSYWTTCEDITNNPGNRLLKATCEQGSGVWNGTDVTLPASYQDIKNCDGQLKINNC